MPKKVQKVSVKETTSTKRVMSLESVYQIWAWTLLLWSLYRYYMKLPEWMDEFVFKPFVFLTPVFWYVLNKERRTIESLGLTMKNFFPSLYVGLGFGLVFAVEGLVSNFIKYGKLNIKPLPILAENGLVMLLLLSLVTAVVEEILNRGFLFNRIYEKTKNIVSSSVIGAVLFVLLHVPILVTSVHLTGATLLMFFVTTFILGLTNNLLFANLGSLVAPILVHVFWNMTVALYL